MVALIAVSAAIYAIDKPYAYRVPSSMSIVPGMRVMVPFGNGNRRCEGIILDVQDGDKDNLKPIEAVLDEAPVLSPAFIRIAAFIRERYFCTFYDAIKAMLPAGLWFHSIEIYDLLKKEWDASEFRRKPDALQVLEYLRLCDCAVKRDDVEKQFPELTNLDDLLIYLQKKKYIHSNLDYSRKVQDKTEQIVSLVQSVELTMAYAAERERSAKVQSEVLKLLCSVGTASEKEIRYLTGASKQTLRRLEKLGYVSLSVRDVFRSTLPNFVEPASPLVLNEEQNRAFISLLRQSEQDHPGVGLLYGITGSGKTAVYIQLIRSVLARGKSVILLVPEISLTPQLIQLLMAHFGDTVSVLHSALRVSERYDAWKKIRSGDSHVVIGTRSAVFAPVEHLGLIILDEEQEHTYKSENSPRYHAREVAIYRGSKEQALVVLGSATPSIETMYLAQQGSYSYQSIQGRFNGRNLPKVELVDLKQEIRNGNPSGISSALTRELRKALDHGHQAILFLNKRGAGKCMICVECGAVPSCPRCSVGLTYHSANGRLMCHYCGYSEPAESKCSVCGGSLKAIGTGTQKVEQELLELLPDLKVLRMDADTISASNSHEAVLEAFRKQEAQVLLGTQMVTKGLNFNNVTLVGIVDADMSLYVNHYRASETTFSMLTQVIGRSGRGDNEGIALIQTMTPEHTVLRLAAQQNYDLFYQQEITLRQLHHCPPYSDIFTIAFSGIIESDVLSGAFDFRNMLIAALQAAGYDSNTLRLLGPSPAAIPKINHAFRYRLTLHCSNTKPLRLLLSQQLKLFAKQKKYKGITAYIDVNSYE